jgi:hypothetical protein
MADRSTYAKQDESEPQRFSQRIGSLRDGHVGHVEP